MNAARERLKTCDGTGAQVNDRLIISGKLLGGVKPLPLHPPTLGPIDLGYKKRGYFLRTRCNAFGRNGGDAMPQVMFPLN